MGNPTIEGYFPNTTEMKLQSDLLRFSRASSRHQALKRVMFLCLILLLDLAYSHLCLSFFFLNISFFFFLSNSNVKHTAQLFLTVRVSMLFITLVLLKYLNFTATFYINVDTLVFQSTPWQHSSQSSSAI